MSLINAKKSQVANYQSKATASPLPDYRMSGATQRDAPDLNGSLSVATHAHRGELRLKLDLPRLPGLVEPRVERTVEAQDHEPPFAWNRLHPVILKPFRRARAKIDIH